MLVFDIGGTFIKYAIIKNGQIVLKSKFETPNGSQIVQAISEQIIILSDKYKFECIGISTAGQVDIKTGSILFAGPTIPDYTGVELKLQLERLSGYSVTVLNDVEACIYNYNQEENLLYISLGTGIGGSYKVNNRVLRGENGIALEVGHVAHPHGASFETVCSTKSLLENYEITTSHSISGEQFDRLVEENDCVAVSLMNQFFEDLVLGLVNIKYILDYNYVIIGGGITEAHFFTQDKLYSHLNRLTFNTDVSTLRIEKSELGNDASLLGVYHYITESQD